MPRTPKREGKAGTGDLQTGFELQNPDHWARAVPHALFDRLRREQPVSYQSDASGRGFWAVVRYADVIRVSRDPATYSSWLGGTQLEETTDHEVTGLRRLMINMDPPQHGKYRRLLFPHFTPAALEALAPRIRAHAREAVARMAERGECEFVREFAGEIPLLVISDLLGVDSNDREVIRNLSERLIHGKSQQSMWPPDVRAAAAEMHLLGLEMAGRRRRQPGSDLVTVLTRTRVDGRELGPEEFSSLFLLLAVAGQETLRHLIAGGLLALLEHPSEMQSLRGDPGLLRTGVDEMLRWVSPVIYFRRTATRDVELSGARIPEGSKVALYYISANRDEDVFADPHRFDVRRAPNDHLAFGHGEHTCLGGSLARLETRILFEELLAGIEDIELCEPPERLRSNFVNGLARLRVRCRPAPASRAEG